MTGSLSVKRVTGQALHHYLDEVARLRIAVFREFPYLYDGDLDYERRYLQTYVDCPQAVVVLALDGSEVVGASTGIPMAFEEDNFRLPLVQAGYDPRRVFYCAESVLDKAYRGQGLGVRFFAEREAHAAELGGFDYCCFCAVSRAQDDPRRPAAYEPLDRFWEKRGYRKHPAMIARYRWKDVGEQEQTSKDLEFWVKSVTT